MITSSILAKVYPYSRDRDRKAFVEHLNSSMEKFGIVDVRQVRAFIAQIGVESGQLKYTSENLNYSANGLRSVFGKYFPTMEMAKEYARKPDKIANRVYGKRLGNGDENSGDGWRYRGRGLIQLTGKDNYVQLSHDIGINFVIQPDLVAQPQYAVLSACNFWKTNGLNELALKLTGSQEDNIFKAITRRINGGYNGLDERRKLYTLAKKYIE